MKCKPPTPWRWYWRLLFSVGQFIITIFAFSFFNLRRGEWVFLVGTIGITLVVLVHEFIYYKIALKHQNIFCISSSIVVVIFVWLILWFLEDIAHFGVVCSVILFDYNCKKLDLIVYIGLDAWAICLAVTELVSFSYRSIRKEITRE
jgi:hypothetical protein